MKLLKVTRYLVRTTRREVELFCAFDAVEFRGILCYPMALAQWQSQCRGYQTNMIPVIAPRHSFRQEELARMGLGFGLDGGFGIGLESDGLRLFSRILVRLKLKLGFTFAAEFAADLSRWI